MFLIIALLAAFVPQTDHTTLVVTRSSLSETFAMALHPETTRGYLIDELEDIFL
jgi:hypothetical protein